MRYIAYKPLKMLGSHNNSFCSIIIATGLAINESKAAVGALVDYNDTMDDN